MQPERYKLESTKYYLDGVSLKEGDVYTLPRAYDVAHVIIGEVEYGGQTYADKKNFKDLAADTPVTFIKPSIVLLGYAK